MRSREEVEKQLQGRTGVSLKDALQVELLLDIRDLLEDKWKGTSQLFIKTTGKLTEEDIARIKEAVKGT